MIQSNIALILFITGGITASMILQFFAPRLYLKTFNQLDVSDPVGLFFARFWALMVGLVGALLIWAGMEPSARGAVIAVAAVGKGIFVAFLLTNFRAFARGYMLVIVFDATCVVLYSLYLLGY